MNFIFETVELRMLLGQVIERWGSGLNFRISDRLLYPKITAAWESKAKKQWVAGVENRRQILESSKTSGSSKQTSEGSVK